MPAAPDNCVDIQVPSGLPAWQSRSPLVSSEWPAQKPLRRNGCNSLILSDRNSRISTAQNHIRFWAIEIRKIAYVESRVYDRRPMRVFGQQLLAPTYHYELRRLAGYTDEMRRPVSRGMRYAPNVRRARGAIKKGDRL